MISHFLIKYKTRSESVWLHDSVFAMYLILFLGGCHLIEKAIFEKDMHASEGQQTNRSGTSASPQRKTQTFILRDGALSALHIPINIYTTEQPFLSERGA